MQDKQPYLEVLNVSKKFKWEGTTENGTAISTIKDGWLEALSNVSFTLKSGDRLGIIGLNGAGKSTLLKMIAGLVTPSAGTIRYSGRCAAILETESYFNQELSGIENARFYLAYHRFPFNQHPNWTEQIALESGLGIQLEQLVKQYSSGMKTRLSMSLLKLHAPDILLLDEALNAGDAQFRKQMQTLFQNLFAQTPISILVSHDMQEVQQYCNLCILLDRGRVVFYGNVDEAILMYYNQNRMNLLLENAPFIHAVTIRWPQNKHQFKRDEEVVFHLSFSLATAQICLPLITVFAKQGSILTDSVFYRPSYETRLLKPGTYVWEISIPRELLNIGQFSISVTLGDGNQILGQYNYLAFFEIQAADWEVGKPWETMQYTPPVRKNISWTLIQNP